MISGSNSSKSENFDEVGYEDSSSKSCTGIPRNPLWYAFDLKKSSKTVSKPRKPARVSESPGKRWGHSSIVSSGNIIIFGGRHMHRSLANLYCFDLNTYTWNKIEPLGQTPPARDSHSTIVVIYKNKT